LAKGRAECFSVSAEKRHMEAMSISKIRKQKAWVCKVISLIWRAVSTCSQIKTKQIKLCSLRRWMGTKGGFLSFENLFSVGSLGAVGVYFSDLVLHFLWKNTSLGWKFNQGTHPVRPASQAHAVLVTLLLWCCLLGPRQVEEKLLDDRGGGYGAESLCLGPASAIYNSLISASLWASDLPSLEGDNANPAGSVAFLPPALCSIHHIWTMSGWLL
jgi:hypothetical protein